MNNNQNLFDIILEKRGLPGGESEYEDINPDGLPDLLLRHFSKEEIEAEISLFLKNTASGFRSGQVPDSRNSFLNDCCLFMAEAEHGIKLPKALVTEIVRSFPAVHYYMILEKFVARYLNMNELLESLAKGLTPLEPILYNCLSCMEGIRLYLPYPRRTGPRDRTAMLVSHIDERLDSLSSHKEDIVRETSLSAKIWMGPIKIRLRFESRETADPPPCGNSQQIRTTGPDGAGNRLSLSDIVVREFRLRADETERILNENREESLLRYEKMMNTLLEYFSAEEIESEIIRFLKKMTELSLSGSMPDFRNRFHMNVYLSMAGSDSRIRLPEPLIADIVRLFPSIWLHEPVPEVVRKYLSIDDLLEILSEGLSPQEQDLICINCMEGIKLAFDLISDRPDSVTMRELSDRTLKLISEIESRLDNLNGHEDNLVREVAISAKQMTEGLRNTCLFFTQTARKNRQASQQTTERRAKARAARPEDRERNLPRAVAKRRNL